MAANPRPTISRSELLDGAGTDQRFRKLINDLLSFSSRLTLVRDGFGEYAGLSGPQYSMLMVIARVPEPGLSVAALAAQMHVSAPFVTAETGKLQRLGLIHKQVNPQDRRGVLMTLSANGTLLLDRVAAVVGQVNDVIFRDLDAGQFDALAALMPRLVGALEDAISLQEMLQRNHDRHTLAS